MVLESKPVRCRYEADEEGQNYWEESKQSYSWFQPSSYEVVLNV